MVLAAKEIETSFTAMYTQLTEIQDPILVGEILQEVLGEHPSVTADDGEIDVSGDTEEGVEFARHFARRCNQLLGTPEDFFMGFFKWEQHGPMEGSPDVTALVADMSAGRSYLVKEFGKENVDGALATFNIAKFSEITPQKEGILRASLNSRAQVVEAQKMISDAFPDK